MSESETKGLARFKQFPRTFWFINGVELLERGAYYSLSAALTVAMIGVFSAQGMPLAEASGLATTIGAVLFLMLYSIPVLSAPFSEKFGYKAALMVVFALLTAGYGLLWFATTVPLVIASVMLIGVGAGIFKPIPASLVTQTSSDSQRSFAFSIYYAAINIGALVFPGILAILALTNGWKDEDLPLHRAAFVTAALLSAANLLLCAVAFRNLRAPQRDKNVIASLKTLGEVFRYPSFLVLMLIYAGFWFMYALVLTVLTAYMGQFDRMPDWFTVNFLQTINPAVIIIGAPLLAPLSTRFKPLVLMITGIIIYAFGLVVIGFSSLPALFFTGLVVYSVGELLTHPAYLGYVSKIAPPEKASVFLGYGFIPIGVGQFLGAKLGGDLYADIAIVQGRPEFYWALMAMIGLATAAALIVYNHFMTRKAGAPGETGARRRVPFAPFIAAGILLLGAGVVVAGQAVPPSDVPEGEGIGTLSTTDLVTLPLDPISGQATADAAYVGNLTMPANATGDATLTLTWQDEAAETGYRNAPDSFTVTLTAPNGTEVQAPATANDASGKGTISLKFAAAPGEWKVEVAVAPGAQSLDTPAPAPVPIPGGLPAGSPPADDGNDFSLATTFQASKA